MNIAFVNSTRKWGGVKTWTLEVAEGLSDCGHHILIASRPGPFLNKARDIGLETLDVFFGPDFNPTCILKFLTIFRSRSIDLVVVNVGKDMRTAGVAAKLLDIPVIHRVGLAGDMLNTYKVRNMHKWVRPRILVPCEQIKSGILEKLSYLDTSEIKVILTGKQPTKNLQRLSYSPRRLITTSQLNEDKCHKEILMALSILRKHNYDYEYHIVGTGRIEAELKKLAVQENIHDKIFFHGFKTEVRSLLRKSDIFILPSQSEGMPNTLLEAMAEGLACIARNVGGIKECWPQAERQQLLPMESDHTVFAQKLSELLTMPDEQLIVMKHNFWQAAKDNSQDQMIKLINDFFNDTVARHKVLPSSNNKPE